MKTAIILLIALVATAAIAASHKKHGAMPVTPPPEANWRYVPGNPSFGACWTEQRCMATGTDCDAMDNGCMRPRNFHERSPGQPEGDYR
jgi:hypothetical protein